MASDRVRLKLAAPVDLVANSGEIVGRLLAIEVDLAVGSRGREGLDEPAAEAPEQQALRLDDNATESTDSACLGTSSSAAEFQRRAGNNVTASRVGFTHDRAQITADVVQRVWEHYERVVPGGGRYTLDGKRRQMIRNALAVRSLELVLAAIDGLAASPHHNGQNDRRKRYLGIQYALKGRDGEGNDERIDKMAAKAKATLHDYLDNLPSAGREMVAEHMTKVGQSLRSPQDENLRRRAEHSVEYLREQHGLAAHMDGDEVRWTRTPTS